MEERGTGLRPQRLPGEWEKRPLEMTKEPDQGALKTSRPTARRDLNPNQAASGGFMGQVMAARPSAQSRAMHEPIGTEIADVLTQAPDGGIGAQLFDQGGLEREIAQPMESQIVVSGGFPGPDGIMVTKGGVKGGHLAKGTI